MAADMLKEALNAENLSREAAKRATDEVERLKVEAEEKGKKLILEAKKQAESRANIILSDARYSAEGVIKQAEKLAEMREKKSIADTEKLYDEAIKLIFEELTK